MIQTQRELRRQVQNRGILRVRQPSPQPRQRRTALLPAGIVLSREVGAEKAREHADALDLPLPGDPQIRQQLLHEPLETLQPVRQRLRAQLPAERLQLGTCLRGVVLCVIPAGEGTRRSR